MSFHMSDISIVYEKVREKKRRITPTCPEQNLSSAAFSQRIHPGSGQTHHMRGVVLLNRISGQTMWLRWQP